MTDKELPHFDRRRAMALPHPAISEPLFLDIESRFVQLPDGKEVHLTEGRARGLIGFSEIVGKHFHKQGIVLMTRMNQLSTVDAAIDGGSPYTYSSDAAKQALLNLGKQLGIPFKFRLGK